MVPFHAHSAALLHRVQNEWRSHGAGDLCLFAYGSLIWRPDFDYVERTPGFVKGYHRCLKMRSRTHRGSHEQPGLVLALVSGGSCRGLVYRIDASAVMQVLSRLWEREMPTGAYEPRWLPARLETGEYRRTLAFTLSRRSPSWMGDLSESELLHIFRHARGRYGSTLEYVLKTVQGLREQGIRDAELERQAQLAERHGLC